MRYLIAVLAILSVPQAAAGQACIGAPVGTGGAAGEIAGTWTDGSYSAGGAVRSVSSGGVGVHAGYGIGFPDESPVENHAITLSVSPDLASGQLSLCPVVEANMEFMTGGPSLGGWTLAGGLGVGGNLGTGEGGWVPFATAALAQSWIKGGVAGETVDVEDTFGAFSMGIMYEQGRFYLGPEASITTLDGDDPSLGLRFGVGL